MLNNSEGGVTIPDELQKNIDAARGRLTLMEQEYNRVGLLVKDQESIIRSLLEKQVQIQSENEALEARKIVLLDEVGTSEQLLAKTQSEVAVLRKERISIEDYIKLTKKEVEDLTTAKKSLVKEIADKREEHNAFLRDSEAKNKAKTKEADEILASLQTKKAKLEKALAEL